MLRRTTSPTFFLAIGFFALACSDGGSTRVDEEVHHLRRAGGSGGVAYVEIPGGIPGMGDVPPSAGDEPGDGDPGDVPPWPGDDPDGDGTYYPDPGMPTDCAFLRYREISTTVLDASGNVISTAYEYCTQCFAADLEPVGEESCTSDPLPPPIDEPLCWEEWTPEGEVCSVCVDGATGEIIDDSCGYYTDPGYPTDPGEDFCWEDVGPDGAVCRTCVDASGVVIDDTCGWYTEPPPPDDCSVGFCEARPDCCEGAWDESCDRDFLAFCGDPTFPPDDPGFPPGEPCPPPPGGEPDDDGTLPDGM